MEVTQRITIPKPRLAIWAVASHQLAMTQRPPLHLLVLASTYPRWKDDHEPSFVHHLASRLTKHFTVHVLTPHALGAARSEIMEGVHVWRYTYAPERLELLVNDGGINVNLRRSPWKLLLVPGFVLGLAWNARRLVRRLRPNVVHAHWIIPQGLAIALLSLSGVRQPPMLLTSHGADLYSMRSPLISRLKRWAVSSACAVTVVSDAMQVEARRLGATNIRVEPMGVDLTRLFVPPVDGRGRSPNEILFVGRLVPKKGLRTLIESMPAIRAARPAAFLTVVGFGPEQAELQVRVVELGLQDCVHFEGPKAQSELPPYYQRAAVFVAPFIQTDDGDQEGLGLVVVEALGCACPVIVSDLPQVGQTIDAGIHAMRVAPDRADSLADAVVRQLSTPYDEAKHHANAKNVRARFDWDAVAGRYAALLMELAL